MWDDVPFTFAATFTSVTVCFNFLPKRCDESKILRDVSENALLMILLVFYFLLLCFVPVFRVSGMRVWWIIIISWDIKAPRKKTSTLKLPSINLSISTSNWQAIKMFFLCVNGPRELARNNFESNKHQQRKILLIHIRDVADLSFTRHNMMPGFHFVSRSTTRV